ncbi:hypothetical protein DSM25558_2536 [Agrobacterium sp. DSM 25558]|uniref:Uncharacterized protein n=1 Tax=Agrobacterium rosae TaxID=1972867 RepID=A0A1R3THY5_9HYPH|nr:hypothetical protein DSM25559_0817 [Agrobacterium rosae]SCX19076.1 hypothetical protein DSM25558_2536 [Agrobacterium sp. DSM 25558]
MDTSHEYIYYSDRKRIFAQSGRTRPWSTSLCVTINPESGALSDEMCIFKLRRIIGNIIDLRAKHELRRQD